MSVVRFILKGEDQETVFNPIRAKEYGMVLYGKSSDGKELRIPLKQEDGIFILKGENPFEEDEAVVNERLLGLSQEWLDTENSGLEASFEDDYTYGKPGYSPDDIYVESKPFSIPQLIQFIEDGDIEISPNFQRNFVWDRTRKSRLIESIFLGLPLPSIYFSQYKDGRLAIVDGLQRLHTIDEFYHNELRLSNLEYLVECNGCTYKELEGILSPLRLRRFKQTQIMGFVIDYRSPSALKFDLFKRLNTGGKPLNAQEIRNCMSRPGLQKTLHNMVSCDEFIKATDGSVSDVRMAAQELALRFIYFYDQYDVANPIGNYSGRIDDELNNFIDFLNSQRQDELDNYCELFKTSLRSAYRIFHRFAFRKIDIDYQSARRTPINKLLFTTITVIFARHATDYEKKLRFFQQSDTQVMDSLAQLINDDKSFFSALTWSTNAKWNFEYVYGKLKNLFDSYLL